MAVTIKDVARHCGVSYSTVSGVLGKRSHLFTEDMRDRVTEAARELGYRPHAGARAMRTGSFNAVTMIMSSNGAVSGMPPYFLRGLQESLQERNFNLYVTMNTDEQLSSNDYLPDLMRSFSSDGVIMNYTLELPMSLMKMLHKVDVPMVWVNTKRNSNTVRPDDMGATGEATRILLSHGHKKVAYVYLGMNQHYSTADRRIGYENAMCDAGLQPQIIYLQNPKSSDEQIALFKEMLEQDNRPTAVLAHAEHAMHLFYAAINVLNLRVPDDLSILTISEPYPFGIGSVVFDAMVLQNSETGKAVGKMILERIDNRREEQPARLIPMEYRRGKTVGPAPS